MLKIISNRNEELANEAEMQLNSMFIKYGARYCPCALEHNEDTICICKKFKEQTFAGECDCGRYEKIDDRVLYKIIDN